LSIVHPAAIAAALALIPLMWWLHRMTPRGIPISVASLKLFTGGRPAPQSTDQQVSRQTSPAWIPRALLALVLCGAIAGLQSQPAPRPIVIWIDSSPSMYAREQGTIRLEQGLELLSRQLAASGNRRATVRSLARADFSWPVSWPLNVADLAHRLPPGRPALPDARLLDRRAEHWLLTDGADASIPRWLSLAPIERVIPVGSSTENVAVVRLAIRASLQDSGRSDVLVAVHNGGLQPATRRLELRANGAPLAGTELKLLPQETRTERYSAAAPPLRLEAGLTPADALPEDDSLQLTVTEPLATPVAVDPACGAAVATVLAAHPGIIRVPEPRAQLLVDCSGRFRNSLLPRLVAISGPSVATTESPAYWNPRVGVSLPPVPAGTRINAAPLLVGAGDEPVLSSAQDTIAVLHPTPVRTVETALDLQDDSTAKDAGYALLIAGLLDVAHGSEMLAPVRAVDRSIDSTRIAAVRDLHPGANDSGQSSVGAKYAGPRSDWALALLIPALALLLWETAGSARQLFLLKRQQQRNVAS
jgi:hypothetical protein